MTGERDVGGDLRDVSRVLPHLWLPISITSLFVSQGDPDQVVVLGPVPDLRLDWARPGLSLVSSSVEWEEASVTRSWEEASLTRRCEEQTLCLARHQRTLNLSLMLFGYCLCKRGE